MHFLATVGPMHLAIGNYFMPNADCCCCSLRLNFVHISDNRVQESNCYTSYYSYRSHCSDCNSDYLTCCIDYHCMSSCCNLSSGNPPSALGSSFVQVIHS